MASALPLQRHSLSREQSLSPLLSPGCAGSREQSTALDTGRRVFRLQQTRNADDVLAVVRALGVVADAWEGDLSDPDTIPMLFEKAEQSLGPVEVLVNNAAYWEADTFLPTEVECQTSWSNCGAIVRR
jgi:NAD(P)-dependent dehydrogenase (short-subunit alcohol dehydrogenase family)